MKKILVLGISILFLISCHQAVKINLNIEDGEIRSVIKVDNDTFLFWGEFFYKNNPTEKEIWLYLYNKNKKRRTFLRYLKADTDKEIAIIYYKKLIEIGPTGEGVVKKDFVSWRYGQNTQSGDIILTLKHYKDFNVETKKGKLVKKYIFNLTKLAKELAFIFTADVIG